MLVLHLSMLDGRFQLWGEVSLDHSTRPRPRVKREGRRPKGSVVAAEHPFGAMPAELAKTLDSMSMAALREASQAVAWLPSVGGRPVASTPLLNTGEPGRGEALLSPWRIPTFRMESEEALEFLCQAGRGRVLAPGAVAGPSLGFWADALALAAAMTARQAFLPGVVNLQGELEARWLPVYRGDDGEALQALCESMPASARCLTSPQSRNAPAIPAKTVVERFVQSTLDRMVRSSRPRASSPRIRFAAESVDEAWLNALTSPDGHIDWKSEEGLADLETRINEWHRSVLLTAHAKFRLCFRLDEPIPGGTETASQTATDEWRVVYLLHPREDRSLLVPVADLWKRDGRKLSVLSRFGDVREYLLTALGQAAGICPPIAASLRSPNPGGLGLQTAQAHEFLTCHAPALETAGFGVLLPAWWTGRGSRQRLGVRAKAKSPAMQAGAGLSLRQVIDVDWELALGDSKISLDELYKLAQLKTPLVRIRGQWLELDANQLTQVAALWQKTKGGRQFALADLFRVALGADAEMDGVPLIAVEADGWIAELLEKLKHDQSWRTEPTPAGFQGSLRPYQARGYSWLSFLRKWGLGACLADDMGLGKTIQTLALIERERETGALSGPGRGGPVLLICPTSVLNNWRREAERFTPAIRTLVHHGVGRRRDETFLKAIADFHLVITSYALLNRDLKSLQKVDWAGVILDEAQNIKNPETAQSKAARSLRGEYRIALTGTPVENHVGDLWAIMEFLNPGLLGGEASFKRTFFRPIQLLGSPEATEQLKRLTGPFILRRVKTDRSIISDLPEKMEMKTFCTLTKEQASLYAAVVAEAETGLQEADGIRRRGLVLATLSKLKQVCNHPAQFLGDNSALEGRSGKLARLEEMLEEILETRERALIFTQFAQMGELLKRHMERSFGRETLFLHGGVPKARRDELVERFQREGAGPPFFVLSLKAGGTGLNLTRASHVFHYDRWWNPAVESQATDRAFRIGQTERVQVHKFICAGTLEERIDAMIEGKSSLASQVVGSGEGWLTRLSNQELTRILQLGNEATAV